METEMQDLSNQRENPKNGHQSVVSQDTVPAAYSRKAQMKAGDEQYTRKYIRENPNTFYIYFLF